MRGDEDSLGRLAGSRISQDQIRMLKTCTLHVPRVRVLDLLWTL